MAIFRAYAISVKSIRFLGDFKDLDDALDQPHTAGFEHIEIDVILRGGHVNHIIGCANNDCLLQHGEFVRHVAS